jgi:hypothetical protein
MKTYEPQSPFLNLLRSPNGLALIAFLVLAAFYLITEHTAHVLGVLPYVFFLLCPLLHLFMHGGHSDHVDAHEQHSSKGNT